MSRLHFSKGASKSSPAYHCFLPSCSAIATILRISGQCYPVPFQYFPISSHNSYQSMQNAQTHQLLLEKAKEIRYKGRDLPFIFYNNQINNAVYIPAKRWIFFEVHKARQAISAMVPPVTEWDVDSG